MIRQAAKCYRAAEQSYWHGIARFEFLARGIVWPRGLKIKGRIGLSAFGKIHLGENITIVSSSKYNRAGIHHPTQLVAAEGAVLRIGDNVGISGAAIVAHESVSIGDHVLIGANARIYDTDFHPMDYMDRRLGERAETAPVNIEDDVWLGANVTVLKGVRIGARSVLAAGSIVTRDIPANCLAAGVPAKVIRSLRSE